MRLTGVEQRSCYTGCSPANKRLPMGDEKIDVIVTATSAAILINDLPHVLLRRPDLMGVESYDRTTGVAERRFYIEFIMSGGTTIMCNYDRLELWVKVLAALRDAKLFDHRFGQNAED